MMPRVMQQVSGRPGLGTHEGKETEVGIQRISSLLFPAHLPHVHTPGRELRLACLMLLISLFVLHDTQPRMMVNTAMEMLKNILYTAHVFHTPSGK